MRERQNNLHHRSRISLRSIRATALVGWAKALARSSTQMRDSRAPCPPTEPMPAAELLVGTAHESLRRNETPCQRLCPPYKLQTVATFWQIETMDACDFNGDCRGVGLPMIFSARHLR